MTLHKMAPVDAAWFHMDGRANLAMVTSVMLTSKPLDFDKVKALYAARLGQVPRFRQRVVEHGFPVPLPHWEDVPDFDIGQHMHHIALPQPRDRRALTELLSDLVSTPLDPLQPLWQAHLIDDVDGGSALVTRFHHCIGDGTAMTALAQQLFDVDPDAPPQPQRAPAATAHQRRGGSLASVFDGLGASTRAVLSTANAALDALRHPQELIDRAALIAGGAGMVLYELLKPDDPASPFKGSFSLSKRVAWSEPVDIGDVKAIGALAGAKVNDVLVAGMTGALRAYLKGRGVDVDRTTLRAMVPVDLRPPERALELGNDFGLVILELPVAARTALGRLRLTKAHMDALKRSAEPVAMRVLLDIFGRTPKAVAEIPVSMFGSKASVVMTNVAGARQTLYLTGVPIERIMFWVPHPGEQLGMGISIQSYRGQATLAVVSDAHLVPDPETITRRFNREFATLLSAARGAAARATTAGSEGEAARKPAASTRRVRTSPEAPASKRRTSKAGTRPRAR
ncbi:MAG: wax ester/triacylglycerol synthase family O-acyltransferase [Rhodocyclaceae bacterium]|nr:wax ester/triacylglycerol synthase family O-acyltransferase [Rhodocyclaceae bacterium]